MRTWMLVGSLVAGVLVFVYEWYSNREQDHPERPHGPGGSPMSEEDYIEINTTSPAELGNRGVNNRNIKLPESGELCGICLESLTDIKEMRKHCIISLPQCGHWFHQKCAYRLLEYHPHCPICRIDIDGNSLRGRPVRVVRASDESDQENQ